MCGFSGVASPYYQENREWLLESSETIIHRGPDDFGIFWNDQFTVGLAHRRLSIIDLSESGKQPMMSNDKKIILVFNGEIYNYRELREELKSKGHFFKSSSDTEVIIESYKEWGMDMPNKLNGMFSIALYDKNIEKLFLIRDRAGEKPLFYFKNSKGIFFSSELKALFSNKLLPRNIDLYGLSGYLSMGHKPNNVSLVEGFEALEPGHILEYSCKSNIHKIEKYWSIPKPCYSNKISEDYLLNKLEYLLEDAIRIQMRADVPIGFHLSGGIDSSLITGIASRISDNIRTYSITFPEFKEINEIEHSTLIANTFNTNHCNIELNSSDFETLFKKIPLFDEPIGDSSLLACWLLSKKVGEDCKVALAGDGADELFGGYKYYRRLYYLKKIGDFLPNKINSIIYKRFLKDIPLGFKFRGIRDLISTSFNDEIHAKSIFFDRKLQKLLVPSLKHLYKHFDKKNTSINYRNLDIIEKSTRIDFINYMRNDILVKIDSASMLNSVELRSPFLDYRLINFAFSEVPSNYKLRNNTLKYLLKNLAVKILPKEFNYKRKKGFIFPINQFINHNKNIKYIKDVLLDENSLFNKSYIQKLFEDNEKGINNANHIFLLLQLDIWVHQNKINF